TLLILIGLHVLGVLLESRLSGENLARSMVSGIKRIAPSSLPTGVTWYGSILGIFILSIAVTVSLFGLPAWSSILPAATLPASVSNTLYERECGDCHHGLHPSLLPEKTWTTVMDGLSNHFGEDATLSAETKEELSRYLVENSADHWDTKGANLFRPPAPDDPLRITATKRWRRIHRELAPEIFKNPKVGGKTNCAACHGDAATGMFADAKIKVPEKK
ncbi:MAG: hypothetical protein OEY85_11665, partial [Rhodospirillales bacterium]|nr:hypothetical protein [Rhodospirillales bacterium]